MVHEIKGWVREFGLERCYEWKHVVDGRWVSSYTGNGEFMLCSSTWFMIIFKQICSFCISCYVVGSKKDMYLYSNI